MGQRSQVYIRYESKNDEKQLSAYHFQWNYGDRMISRAVKGIDWLQGNKFLSFNSEKIPYIFAVNQDYNDVVLPCDILKETKEYIAETNRPQDFNEELFLCQDNNDGCLYVDVSKDGNVKYAFTNGEEYYYKKFPKPLTAEEYMDSQDWYWESAEEEEMVETCKKNIEEIGKLATLMTQEELTEFICYDYEHTGKDIRKEIQKVFDKENKKNKVQEERV